MRAHPLAFVVALAACGASGFSVRAPARAPSNPGWTYDVVASPGGDEIAVEAAFAPGTLDELTVEEGGEPFLLAVELADGDSWKPVARQGLSWFAPSCARGCRLRYRVALREAGRASGRVAVARAHAGAVESPPSTWLLRPVRAPLGTPFRFHVTSAPGEAFASGVFPSHEAKDTYEGTNGDIFQLPYAAFGRVRVRDLYDGKVQVAILPGRLDHEDDLLAWVTTSARAVEKFYARFPVPRLLVIVRPVDKSGVGFGTAIGNAGAAIAVDVGSECGSESFRDDWVLVHEMVHTALPDVRGPHRWLEEGLSTYVEPLARARAGLAAPEDVWRDWVRGMPNGLPEEGDRGLDRTPTWGRTYWGGALFCFLADLEIRTRTFGKKSLDDALRAIVASGGNISVAWPIEKILEIGDRAVGAPVLRELYGRMSHDPAPVDLTAIWKRLGVVVRGTKVAFDDTAPLTRVRRRMTEAAPSP